LCQRPRYDTSHPSANHDSRVQFVIVHYTSASLARSLQLLTHGEVSSHYLIGDDKGGTIYKLMDENQRAWHAGESQWQAAPGSTPARSASKSSIRASRTRRPRLWYPYSEAQIQSLIVLLKDISQRQGISPRHIIGHSDIAPLRKLDPVPCSLETPGCRRPGRMAQRTSGGAATAQFNAELPSITWFQAQLARRLRHPQTGELDVATRHVLAAFQMHFALHASTAHRTHKRQRCCRSSIRQNNDARPTVRAKRNQQL
jgi:N-acetylmuramoyl-L-alanine amidase